ncbi:MAG: TIGR01777 family oxidoreductase [Nocardioidaceae bacterium]
MRVLVAGASGFLGRAWTAHLRANGHDPVRLVRRDARPGDVTWDPYSGHLDPSVLDGVDAVACLSGATIVHWPWTASYRKTFRDSRVVPTRVLAEAVAASDRKPPMVAQNGVAGYGDHGDHVITERTPTDADTFLGGVTRDWERATDAAAAAGARLVVLRTAVVLDREGGALKPMLLQFRAGAGGPIGGGRQYFATISLLDWLRAATHLTESGDGVYNVAGPHQTTNREFVQTLARLLHRPAVLPAPALPIKLFAGPASSDILGSARVEPRRLLDEGFTFEHPTLVDRLTAALH